MQRSLLSLLDQPHLPLSFTFVRQNPPIFAPRLWKFTRFFRFWFNGFCFFALSLPTRLGSCSSPASPIPTQIERILHITSSTAFLRLAYKRNESVPFERSFTMTSHTISKNQPSALESIHSLILLPLPLSPSNSRAAKF